MNPMAAIYGGSVNVTVEQNGVAAGEVDLKVTQGFSDGEVPVAEFSPPAGAIRIWAKLGHDMSVSDGGIATLRFYRENEVIAILSRDGSIAEVGPSATSNRSGRIRVTLASSNPLGVPVCEEIRWSTEQIT